jgi:hypothetical protein
MTRGFKANVPVRKPRTQLGRVISELTAEPEARPEVAEEQAARGATADPERSGASDSTAAAAKAHVPEAPPAVPAAAVPREVAPPRAPPAKGGPPAPSRISSGREHIARLRERLAVAAHPPTGVAEPKRTAAAVREIVDGLRARLESAARERSEQAGALEEARTALAGAEAGFQKERRAREALEAQAEERRLIAAEAVVEAEALAAERDQVIGELAEYRRLESEQATILVEAEAVLERREAERESAARELAEARELLALRSADLADLEARLEAEAAARARVEARCRELEAEVLRLSEASEALESIEAMVTRNRLSSPGP